MASFAPEFSKTHYPNGLNANFKKDDADFLVKEYGQGSGKFENPETRDIAKCWENLADALVKTGKLDPGMTAVDVGAGTGLWTFFFAEKVGPSGRVVGTELSEGFLKILRQKDKETRGDGKPLAPIDFIQSSETETGIPSDLAADLVLLCDVYHHFEFPKAQMASIRRALLGVAEKGKGPGLLAFVDFHRDPAKIWSHPPEWVLEHVRAGKEEFTEEVISCGFRLKEELEIANMRENYFILFEPVGTEAMSEAN